MAELTGGREGSAEQPDERIADSRELLHRVVRGVRAGDRDRLHRDLRGAHADVGLGLAAVAPPLLRDLASELLGHPPRGDDLAPAGVLTGVLLDRLGRDLPAEGAGGVRTDNGGASGGRPVGRVGEPVPDRLPQPGRPSRPTGSGDRRDGPWSGAPSRPTSSDGSGGRPRRGIDG